LSGEASLIPTIVRRPTKFPAIHRGFARQATLLIARDYAIHLDRGRRRRPFARNSNGLRIK
jgi:hypothetical protein